MKLGQFYPGRNQATRQQTFLAQRLPSKAHIEVSRDDRFSESEVVTVGCDP